MDPSSCKHRRTEWSEKPRRGYFCLDCDLRICTDCGTRPSHRDSLSNYCRRCGEKGGDRHSFVTTIDHDALRAKVGDELAESILRECRAL